MNNKQPDISGGTEYSMKKGSRRSLILLSVLLIVLTFSMSSCYLLAQDPIDYLTKEEVQQMIDNGMYGEITVEGGDNYNVTINNADRDNVSAAKAILSSVSIKCVFKTTSYGLSASREKVSAGSGVIYKIDKNKGDAYVITNYHVVYHNQSNTENGISKDISLYLYGQESAEYAIPATYIGGSMNYDIAVLKVTGSKVLAESNAVPIEIADSDEVAVLDRAIAVGNPEDLGLSATLGYINVDSEYITMEGADGATTIQIRVMRTDTSVNSGNSGGGLFNSNGELIGIVNAKLTQSDNMSYAIPSNFVKYVADNIIHYCDGTEYEGVYRCYLGITVSASKKYTEYDKETGVVHKREQISVDTVDKNGLANGLIEVGDIINSITVDGVTYDVDRMHIVTDTMLNARVGSKVTVNVTRDGKKIDVAINITKDSLSQVE